MKYTIAVLAVIFSPILVAETCLEHMSESYCKVWEKNDDGVHTVEFLKKDESLKSWSEMITVRKYEKKKHLKEVLPGYIKSVQPMFALKPDILSKDGTGNEEDILILLTLLSPNKSHYEYVVNHFYHTGSGVVWSVFYTHKLPFAKEVNFNEILENRSAWISSVAKIKAEGAFKDESL